MDRDQLSVFITVGSDYDVCAFPLFNVSQYGAAALTKSSSESAVLQAPISLTQSSPLL
jgi:hypothetical protein